jgi:hypothetical protein
MAAPGVVVNGYLNGVNGQSVLPAGKICTSGPPPAVQDILASARQRYHKTLLRERPALNDPRSYVGLFTMGDLVTLSSHGRWPLSPRTLDWIKEEPEAARKQRERDLVRLVQECQAELTPVLLRMLAPEMGRLMAQGIGHLVQPRYLRRGGDRAR